MDERRIPMGEILVVEDNPGDRRLLLEAFREQDPSIRLHFAATAREATFFLERTDAFRDAPRADLIFLDLNLTGEDGRKFLHRLKASPRFRRVPVIVLTTSNAAEDIELCYDLRANCYLIKPWSLGEYGEMVKYLVEFWLTIARLPSGRAPLTPKEASLDRSPQGARASGR